MRKVYRALVTTLIGVTLLVLPMLVLPIIGWTQQPVTTPPANTAATASPVASPGVAPTKNSSSPKPKVSPQALASPLSETPAAGIVASASPGVSTPASPGAVATPHIITATGASPAVPIALPSGVVTSGNPTVIVVQAPPATLPPPPQETNSWIPGMIGIVIFAAIIVFGLRYAKQKGMTLPVILQQLGVQMPQDGVASTASPIRPMAPSEPPLPSLADLPPPQPVPVSSNISALKSKVAEAPAPVVFNTPSVVAGRGSMLGLSGSVVGEVFALTESFTVGREKDNTLSLATDGTVSRRHARIERQNDEWVVSDLGSSNGSFINGKRLTAPQVLRTGDEVQFGSVRFRFEG